MGGKLSGEGCLPSLHALSVSAGRLGLALLLACPAIAAQAVTPAAKSPQALPGGVTPSVPSLTPAQARVLKHMKVILVPDGQGGQIPTLEITGVNVRIVNGQGATDISDGRGNLIIGYNEFGNPNGDDRTGSHNIVTGQANNFSSHGGLVAGQRNTVSGAWSSVSGGRDNTASGNWSSVSGGHNRSATGDNNWAAGSLSESY